MEGHAFTRVCELGDIIIILCERLNAIIERVPRMTTVIKISTHTVGQSFNDCIFIDSYIHFNTQIMLEIRRVFYTKHNHLYCSGNKDSNKSHFRLL